MSLTGTLTVKEYAIIKKPLRRLWKIRLITYFLIILTLLLTGCVLSRCTTPPDANSAEATIDTERMTRLKRDVEFLSKDCHPRSSEFPENQIKARDYLKVELRKCIKDVSLQAYEAGDRTYWNIRSVIPGKNPERLIIGAHYDSYDLTPGADDNASGVAGVLELARMLKGCKPEYTIELVLYTNEEPSWFGTDNMGSARHVQQLAHDSVPVKAMICLEMIGFFNENDNSQSYPVPGMGLLYPSQGNFIAIIGNTNSLSLAKTVQQGMKPYLPTVRLNSPVTGANSGLDFSDHRNYWKAGHSAIMLTDTSFFRNKNYHKAGDTSDTLDYSKMGAVVQGLYEAVIKLAGSCSAPKEAQK